MPGTRRNPAETQEQGWRRYGLGKFNSMVDSFLWDATMDGSVDEELGDVQGFGWFGLMVGDILAMAEAKAKASGDELTDGELEELAETKAVILDEDSQGFVGVEYFDDEAEARERWAELEVEEAEFSGSEDEGDAEEEDEGGEE